MKTAFLSGQAGAAVTLGPEQIWRLGSVEPRPATRSVVQQTFRYSTDVEKLTFSHPSELLGRLKSAWSADRALRLFIISLERDQTEEEYDVCAEALEVLLQTEKHAERIWNEFAARRLPPLEHLRRPTRPKAKEIFEAVLSYQEAIGRVYDAFSNLSSTLFQSQEQREQARERLVSSGSSLLLVRAVVAGQSFDGAVFQMTKALEKVPNGRAIVRTMLEILRGTERPAKRSQELLDANDNYWDEADEYWADADGPPSASNKASFEAYLAVKRQIAAIKQKLNEGNLSAAQQFAVQLVASQQANSSSHQIAQSLCNISQAAKEQGYFSLQLDWALLAVEFAPDDARAHGQLADALIGTRQFADAAVALDRVERAGSPDYAAFGRARILRATGQLTEALSAFRAAKATEQRASHYPWSGVAETLREMGRHPEALQEYEEALQRFPNEAALHCGYASVSLDVGQFEIADQHFVIAEALAPTSSIASNGRATLRKRRGQLETALSMYDDVIAMFPQDASALCGKADVLRLSGDHEAALRLYDKCIAEFPGQPVAYGGKADVLIELGRWTEAVSAFDVAADRFDYESAFILGSARVALATGEYARSHLLFEQARKRFPYSLEARFGTANALKRLGRLDEALALLDELLCVPAANAKAMNAKASILILLQRYEEALAVLPSTWSTEEDWVGFFLKGLVYSKTTVPAAVFAHFDRAAGPIPFARVRSLVANLKASIRLGQRRYDEAVQLSRNPLTPIGNVIYLHALAGAKEVDKARLVLGDIEGSFGTPEHKELANEIAAVYHLGDYKSKKTTQWILEQETTELLLAAA